MFLIKAIKQLLINKKDKLSSVNAFMPRQS